MSCYFRHMKDVLEEAGIEVTKENKKDIDRIIHAMADVPYKDCSHTWKSVKARIREDPRAREKFVNDLKTALAG